MNGRMENDSCSIISKKVPEDKYWYFGFSLGTHGKQKTLLEQLPTQIKVLSEYTTNVSSLSFGELIQISERIETKLLEVETMLGAFAVNALATYAVSCASSRNKMQLKHKVSFYQQTIFIHLNSRNVIIKKCP
jgi:hypothetical protein